MRFRLVPLKFDDAAAFVSEHHRHHTPPAGHKFSLGAALGWRVLPLTRELIEDGTAVALIRQALGLGEV